MIRPSHREICPSGFSLLEMLIVLVVVTSMLAIALPSLFRPMAKSALHEAAKQVESALLEARCRAVESGVIQEFRYEPGGAKFEVLARAETDDTGSAVAAMPGAVDLQMPSAALEPMEGELPEGVVFVEPGEATLDASYEPAAVVKPTTVEDQTTGDLWSSPVLFYPNGRSLNARLKLRNSHSWSVEILLRGLLGTSLVGEPHSEPSEQQGTASAAASESMSP